METLYILGSVIVVSLVSIIAILAITKQPGKKTLMALLSLSAGTLLATVFVHFLPELAEEGFHLEVSIAIITGFLLFFLLEKWIHAHHSNKKDHLGHGHAYHLAPINLAGDAVHNFIDGIIIAGAYLASVPLGVAVTISVILHELPQEIADYGVLLYAGMKRKKAILFNFLAALTAVAGALVGILLGGWHEFEHFVIPFAAGGFLYIAAANLVPELHKHCKAKETAVHLLMMLAGIGIMIALAVLMPGH